MTPSQKHSLRLDAASALALGRRGNQQDAIASDFPLGGSLGLAVLADGMGGHPAGEVAAQIAVTEVFSDLKLRGESMTKDIPGALHLAATAANRCIAAHAQTHPASAGMGTTLLVLVIHQLQLYWLSVGDSLLFLFRDNRLRQLNSRHSLGAQKHERAFGDHGPDLTPPEAGRHLLTSCLNGALPSKIDCPDQPFLLHPGDLILMASDGIESLHSADLTRLFRAHSGEAAGDLVAAVLDEVARRNDPDQDNLSLTLISPALKSTTSTQTGRWHRRSESAETRGVERTWL